VSLRKDSDAKEQLFKIKAARQRQKLPLR